MDIRNFTGSTVRIGDFPCCVDVTNIPDYHSNDGVLCDFHLYQNPIDGDKDPRLVIVKSADVAYTVHVLMFRWADQWDKLPEEIRNGVVLYDSASKARGEQ